MKVSSEKLKQIIQEELSEMAEQGEVDEGFLDRAKAGVQSAVAGAKGAVQQKVAGVKGAVKQGAMGLAQKGLGAVGATGAAAEVGAAKQAAQQATAGQKAAIAANTQAQQAAVKFNAAVTPKVAGIEKDMQSLFGGNPPPEFQQVQQALAALKQAVTAVQSKVQQPAAATQAAQPAVAESRKRR